MTCGTCGAELSATARFCDQCGSPLPEGSAQELRKTVTLLFTDVTGSTVLGEHLDPEAYRGIMGHYFELARAAVERHGGTVEKFVGDAVLAVFGVPEVREDDALRAVRAAMEMSTAIQDLSDQLEQSSGVRLEVRTGINTGSVVAGSARAGGAFATGDAVNTAARLEQAAAPGTVLIGQSTYVLVRDAVEVTAVDPVVAKGKAQPVPAYRLRTLKDVDHGRRRRDDTRLVGRERETRVLLDALERTLETGRGHLVTVVGAPGIGKTRLIADFLQQVDGRAAVLTSRCVSYGQGITFWPIVQMLRQAVGLQGDESDELTRHALAEFMSGVDDGAQVVDRLLPILGKHGDPAGTEETFWAVRRALEQLAANQPVVVTVDDLHWAEPTLLELIERVRDEVRDLPLLMVCQARPELLDDRPGWGGGSLNSTIFGLEPFTNQQTADSLSELLGDRVNPDVGGAVAAWAGGNPLFVEEAAAHLVAEGLLTHGSDGWHLAGDLTTAQVPPTVAALLAARLDRLPEQERRLVERLSIAGLELTTDDAVFLADSLLDAADVPAALASLTHRDLLQRRRGHTQETWAFRHLMVRDAAYDSLPKALRASLHEDYADRIQALGDEAAAERHAFVAHHLQQALAFRRDLAPHDPGLAALADRAAQVLQRAASDARHLGDLTSSKLLQTAAALEPLTLARRRSIIVDQFQAAYDREQTAEKQLLAAAYAELLDADSGPADRAAGQMFATVARLEMSEPVPPDELSEQAHRCAELAREGNDLRLLVLALECAATANMMRARWSRVSADLRQIVDLGDSQDRRRTRLFLGACVVWGLEPIQDLAPMADEAEARGVHVAAEAEQLALQRLMVDAADAAPGALERVEELLRQQETSLWPLYREIQLGICAAFAGDNQLAARVFAGVGKQMLDADDLAHASTQLAWEALLRLESFDAGLVDELEPQVEQAAACTSPYDLISVALVHGGRGLIAAQRGSFDEADQHLAEAVRVTAETDQAWQLADTYRWWSLAKAAQGDVAGERRLLELALDGYRRKGLVVWARRCESRLAQLA